MKSKFIAILTLSTLAFFATASAKSDVSTDVKTDISTAIKTEVKTEVVKDNADKSDFKKMREDSKETRKGLLDKIKLDKDDLKVVPPKPPVADIIPPAPKTEEELKAER